jgi:hypothetical protein
MLAAVFVQDSVTNLLDTLETLRDSEIIKRIAIIGSKDVFDKLDTQWKSACEVTKLCYFANKHDFVLNVRKQQIEQEKIDIQQVLLLDEHTKCHLNVDKLSNLQESIDTTYYIPRHHKRSNWITYEPRIVCLWNWVLQRVFPKIKIEKVQGCKTKKIQEVGYVEDAPLYKDEQLQQKIWECGLSLNELPWTFAVYGFTSTAMAILLSQHGTKFYLQTPGGDRKRKTKWWKYYHIAADFLPNDQWRNKCTALRHAFSICARADTAAHLAYLNQQSDHRRESWMWLMEATRLNDQDKTSTHHLTWRSERIHELLTILTFYEDYDRLRGTALMASDKILFAPFLFSVPRQNIINNAIYYMQAISRSKIKQIVDESGKSHLSGVDSCFYVPANPSIILVTDPIKDKYGLPDNIRYIVTVRWVTYFITEHGYYVSRTPDKIIRTRNVLFFLDDEYNTQERIEICDIADRPRFSPRSVIGLEDPKLFAVDGDLYYSCTTPDTSEGDMCQDISLVKIHFDYKQKEGYSTEVYVLSKPDPKRVEKNWCPFVTQDKQIGWLYGCHPLTTCYFDMFNHDVYKWKRHPNPHFDFGSLRGSCCLQPWKYKEGEDGWLAMFHEVAMGSSGRIYTHRLFVFNHAQDNCLAMSNPFYFIDKGIEFGNGLCVDIEKQKVILSFGWKDRTANLATLTFQEVHDMLQPIEKFKVHEMTLSK